jgi:hypothetical protein
LRFFLVGVRSNGTFAPQLSWFFPTRTFFVLYDVARSGSLVLASATARFTSPCCPSHGVLLSRVTSMIHRSTSVPLCRHRLLSHAPTPCFASCSSLLITLMPNA